MPIRNASDACAGAVKPSGSGVARGGKPAAERSDEQAERQRDQIPAAGVQAEAQAAPEAATPVAPRGRVERHAVNRVQRDHRQHQHQRTRRRAARRPIGATRDRRSSKPGSDGRTSSASSATPSARPLTAIVSQTSANDSAVETSPVGECAEKGARVHRGQGRGLPKSTPKAHAGPFPRDDRHHAGLVRGLFDDAADARGIAAARAHDRRRHIDQIEGGVVAWRAVLGPRIGAAAGTHHSSG